MKIDISNGELVDRFTILKIKQNKITNENKLAIVNADVEELTPSIEILKSQFDIEDDIISLQKVNQILWGIEDSIRLKEHNGKFDEEFITLARSVYMNNDNRSNIKLSIDKKTGTTGEVKEYTKYV